MKFRLFVAASLLITAFSACHKYEDLPAPPVTAGDCQYNKSGFSQSFAQSEHDRIIAIFKNSSIGSFAIQVKSSQVYVSSTKDGKPETYGVQVVFGCDGAEIKFEHASGYNSAQDAQNALNARLSTLSAGRLIKVLDAYQSSTSSEECDSCEGEFCDTCEDEEGTYDCNCEWITYDCNCGTVYDYNYKITYAVVNPNNARQAAFIQQYQSFNQRLSQLNAGVAPNVTDTLAAAKKILPAFTTEGKVVRDWKGVIDKMSRLKSEKKECPKKKRLRSRTRSTVKPDSKHRLYL